MGKDNMKKILDGLNKRDKENSDNDEKLEEGLMTHLHDDVRVTNQISDVYDAIDKVADELSNLIGSIRGELPPDLEGDREVEDLLDDLDDIFNDIPDLREDFRRVIERIY